MTFQQWKSSFKRLGNVQESMYSTIPRADILALHIRPTPSPSIYASTIMATTSTDMKLNGAIPQSLQATQETISSKRETIVPTTTLALLKIILSSPSHV